jgi:protein-tyrosine phosphatase
MIPLVDMHCHLLAGVDDGPRTDEEAVEMCRIAWAEGVRLSVALAHQNERWNLVTPQLIRERAGRLADELVREEVPLRVFPCAEVTVHPEIEEAWRRGDLLSVADRGKYLLMEMPRGAFVDLRGIVQSLRGAGVRPVLAHPEQQPELLHEPGVVEELIGAGCLVQVSSGNVTDPRGSADARALKDWFRRGVVHVLGSDGHSPRRRRPLMARAYRRIADWAGAGVADRVCSTNGTAILHGLPLNVPGPEPRARRWFSRFW